MKIKLLCQKTKEEQYRRELLDGNIEFAVPADLIVSEPQFLSDDLFLYEEEGVALVDPNEILYIESIQNMLEIHALHRVFHVKEPLYQMEARLYPKGFLRIHKSFLVNRRHIRQIKTSLNMKYTLVLSNKETLEVSRSYYYQFKEEIGF
ncbi:MAG: LytTR family DNA-binding domain-containing protein [Merdibacter sp.]|nr:LytTR family DNA-binding domain-containing protein [Merdibacter sp.]